METEAGLLLVPVSAGELIDKITILRLKEENINAPKALANIRIELSSLRHIFNASLIKNSSRDLDPLFARLQSVNSKLWNIENELRIMERDQNFGHKFVSLARSVYKINDERAAIKREINEACGSTLTEEKSYGDCN